MKLNKLFPLTALLLVVLMCSCKKDANPVLSSDTTANYSTETGAKKSLYSAGQNQAIVNLGLAGEFVILSKTGITDVYQSSVVGSMGTSPITDAALLLKCTEATGAIYAVDADGTNSSKLAQTVVTLQKNSVKKPIVN